MARMSLLAALRAKLFGFCSARTASTAITFTLALAPVVAAVGAAVDFSRGNSIHAALQDSLDSAALNLVKTASSLTASQVTATANSYALATFNRPDASNVLTTAAYDKTAGVLTLTGSAVMQNQFMGFFGFTQMNIKAVAQAKLAPKTWPVCVLVTSPASNHTLLTQNAATINFDGCMVQVDTQNWDAVEARDTSYIHSTNGDNCFVGDIHYGDITPPKDPTCTFFTDPFAGYAMPASAATCTYTNKTVNVSGTVLPPATYCGTTTISKSTTFSPGVYIIKNGELKITGSGTNVTATGVTFLLTGTNPSFDIDQYATLTQTPDTGADAGVFAGFAFYLDNNSSSPCTDPGDGTKVKAGSACTAQINNHANAATSGIIYLLNYALIIDNGASLTVNPGSIVADFIVPNHSASLSLTGPTGTATSAQIAMQKTGSQGTVTLLVK